LWLYSSEADLISQIPGKSQVVFGCGNILLGDDGFGPRVVECLMENYSLPEDSLVMDVGTGIRNILFDLLLAEQRPKRIIVVDAVDYHGRKPGEVFEIPVEGIPENKVHDFSLHQQPTINLLKELRYYTNTEVVVIVVQVEEIPKDMKTNLSETVRAAIPKACTHIMKYLGQPV
jgi:coenzyme F420 hydrogenase subunit delta